MMGLELANHRLESSALAIELVISQKLLLGRS